MGDPFKSALLDLIGILLDGESDPSDDLLANHTHDLADPSTRRRLLELKKQIETGDS